ncbi:unnamed protein product [Thlaspi arvense]|uniref:Uncharacterized protein n=1 Tax=Thlaspi arvense TaxID=13288 RepID=A0AAU9SSC6_THLAR|nr:unnamed protein product [Thlaspi arvense]
MAIQNIVKMMTVIALNTVKSNVVAQIHPMVLLPPHEYNNGKTKCNNSANDLYDCHGGHNSKHCKDDDGNCFERCKIKCGGPNPPHGPSSVTQILHERPSIDVHGRQQ